MSVNATRHLRRDPHDILGVPRGADRQQVMQAFRRKARRGGHPDTGGDAQAFDEIVRARCELLDPAPPAHYVSSRRTSPVGKPPKAHPRPAGSSPSAPPRPAGAPPSASPPKETSKLAIATGVLAVLGPLFWPVAIIVGHLALRRIKRTGKGGGAFVPVVLFLLYALTLPALLLFGAIVIA